MLTHSDGEIIYNYWTQNNTKHNNINLLAHGGGRAFQVNAVKGPHSYKSRGR